MIYYENKTRLAIALSQTTNQNVYSNYLIIILLTGL